MTQKTSFVLFLATAIFFFSYNLFLFTPIEHIHVVHDVSLQSTHRKLPNLDLVVLLTGELGNNLAKIAFGKVIQLIALEQEQFNFTLRFVSQGRKKSERPRYEIETCFSTFLSADQVNLAEWIAWSSEWENAVQSQSEMIHRLYANETFSNNSAVSDEQLHFFSQQILFTNPSIHEIRSSLKMVADITQKFSSQSQYQQKENARILGVYNLSVPFVLANAMLFPRDVLSYPAELFRQIHDFFTFDFHNPECCNGSAETDETVLHIRGFEIELKNSIHRKRFRELDPNRTAHQLLGHLDRGDKVAIVSRFSETELSSYVSALKERGLAVRFVSDLNGIQTFCFLISATKEIVGTQQSTFFNFAAYLNQRVASVIMYCLNYTQYQCRSINNSGNRWKIPLYQL